MFELRSKYPIAKMAKHLKVSVSGYYKWLNRRGQIKHRKIEITNKIITLFNQFNGIYGSPRIAIELKAQGVRFSRKNVELIMRNNGLYAGSKQVFRVKTIDSNHNMPISPNLLDQKFDVKEINKVWVSDITYIRVGGRWVYLCVIIDLANREVVGWEISDCMSSRIVKNALLKAVKKRKPSPNLIFHSDRGSQYASKSFQRSGLKHFEMIQSMSRKGNCYDNACAESFFHSLKVEEVYKNKYVTEEVARGRIFNYIEGFYNSVRRHSTLDFESPLDWTKLKKIA